MNARRPHLAPLLVVLVVAGTSTAHAAPAVTVEVDDHTVTVGDTFKIRFIVRTDDNKTGRFDEPAWKGLKVISRSRQSRMQIVNRQVTQSLIFDFNVKARRQGVLVIPRARYRDRTGTGRSRPINLRAVASRTPSAPSPSATGGLELDGADVALVASLDKNDVVKGEQLTLTYTLYTRVRISEYSMDEPDAPGFWKENLTTARQPKFTRRVVNGEAYEAAVVRRYLLFPLEVGNRFIPSTKMGVEKSLGMFNTRSMSRRSNSLNVTVRALPEGAPRGFSGAVGRFKLKVTADRQHGEVGMPVGVKVRLSGEGNFKHFVLKLPDPPDGLRAHPPTTQDHLKIQGGRLKGRRVLEWILTPERAGRFSLGAMRFPYFDPSAGTYKTAVSSPVALRVRPGKKTAPVAPGAAPASAGGAPTDVPKLRPLKAGVDLRPGDRQGHKQPWERRIFWLFTLLAPGIWLSLAVTDRLRARRLATSDERVVRGALRRAKRRLHDAEDYMSEGRSSTLYGELARTMIGYIDDRTGGRTAGLSFGELRGHLGAAGYSDEDVASVMAELEHADAARFTPAGASPDEMRAAMDRVRTLLRRLDRHAPLGGVEP